MYIFQVPCIAKYPDMGQTLTDQTTGMYCTLWSQTLTNIGHNLQKRMSNGLLLKYYTLHILKVNQAVKAFEV